MFAVPPAWAAPAAGGGPLVRLRLANLGTTLASMPQDLAFEKGVFARHGIDLKVVNFLKGGAEATAGVASGQVDMGSYGSPILTGVAAGLPIKIVGAPPNKYNPFDLVAKKGITSVAQLKGTVVTSGALGAGSYQALLKILDLNHLSVNDLTAIPAGGADVQLILRSGRTAAVITQEPITSKLVYDGVGTLLVRARDVFGRYQHSYVFATRAFIKDHPETVRAYFEVEREAHQYAEAHLEEIVAYSKARINLPEPIIRSYFTDRFKDWDLGFKIDLEGTRNAVQVLKDLKEIKPEVKFDPQTWLDLRFL